MAVSPITQPVVGRVESANERGIKIAGQWFNVSKWAGDIALPERGQHVRLTLDGGGFIRGVDLADGSEGAVTSRGAPGAVSAQRDRTITRLAVLKAAAEFAASRPQAASSDVLKVAEVWEAWVTRPYDGPELTDAF